MDELVHTAAGCFVLLMMLLAAIGLTVVVVGIVRLMLMKDEFGCCSLHLRPQLPPPPPRRKRDD